MVYAKRSKSAFFRDFNEVCVIILVQKVCSGLFEISTCSVHAGAVVPMPTFPLPSIRIRSSELLVLAFHLGAVKNIKSLFDESALGDDAMILVFWATLITPPSDPHAFPGP